MFRLAGLPLALALVAALTIAAAPDPVVEQRAFEAIPDGIFIRGGGTTIDTDPRCPTGCPVPQRCSQTCADHPCPPETPPGTVCTACRWGCR